MTRPRCHHSLEPKTGGRVKREQAGAVRHVPLLQGLLDTQDGELERADFPAQHHSPVSCVPSSPIGRLLRGAVFQGLRAKGVSVSAPLDIASVFWFGSALQYSIVSFLPRRSANRRKQSMKFDVFQKWLAPACLWPLPQQHQLASATNLVDVAVCLFQVNECALLLVLGFGQMR